MIAAVKSEILRDGVAEACSPYSEGVIAGIPIGNKTKIIGNFLLEAANEAGDVFAENLFATVTDSRRESCVTLRKRDAGGAVKPMSDAISLQ